MQGRRRASHFGRAKLSVSERELQRNWALHMHVDRVQIVAASSKHAHTAAQQMPPRIAQRNIAAQYFPSMSNSSTKNVACHFPHEAWDRTCKERLLNILAEEKPHPQCRAEQQDFIMHTQHTSQTKHTRRYQPTQHGTNPALHATSRSASSARHNVWVTQTPNEQTTEKKLQIKRGWTRHYIRKRAS